jgi:hypothetical protein
MVCAIVRRENGFFKNLRTSFFTFSTREKNTKQSALNNALNSLYQDCLQCRGVWEKACKADLVTWQGYMARLHLIASANNAEYL